MNDQIFTEEDYMVSDFYENLKVDEQLEQEAIQELEGKINETRN